MSQLTTWLEKAIQKLAISLLTIVFVTTAIAFSLAPSAAARSIATDNQFHSTSGNTSEWTHSPLAEDKTRQAAPTMPVENPRQTNNAQDNLKRNLRSATENVRESLDPDGTATSNTKGFFNEVKERIDTAVEGTKDTFGSAADDVHNTLEDTTKPVRY